MWVACTTNIMWESGVPGILSPGECKVAGGGELLAELQVRPRQPVVMAQRQAPGQETNKLVHLRLKILPAT